MTFHSWTVFLCCFVLVRVSSQCDIAQICVTDVTVSICASGQILAPNMSVFGCCPACVFPDDLGQEGGVITEVCRPPSNCLPDGKFAPVQCRGDMFTGSNAIASSVSQQGVPRAGEDGLGSNDGDETPKPQNVYAVYGDENGRRIFGQMWRSDASEMTCACSRKRAELEASGRTVVSLHCTATGDYEPLQCDDGICWCAEPRTGQPTVTPVMQEDMKRLPCYSSSVMGEQYLRRCESLVHSMAKIHREQSEHGTNFLGNPTTFCDYDGTYGPFQIKNGIAYCTGRDGEILGSWQVIASEMSGMNCNCARDTMIHFPDRGMTVTEICLANGNYRPNQNVGDVFYCVDTDGYPVGEMMDSWPTDNCASHA